MYKYIVKALGLLYVIFEKHGFGILLIWITILSFLYSLLSVIRHNNFQSGGFDLGIYDQAVWQYSRLEYPYNTIKEKFILGDHLTLTLPLFAPLYHIWDDVRILLIAQAVWISFSAVAVYLLSRLRRYSAYVSFCISVIYSLFFGIQYGIYFDWHPVIFGVGLLCWLAYFFEARKRILFWITLILLLLTQENMGLGLTGLGLIYIFKPAYRKQAIIFIFGGIVYSMAAAYVVSLFSPTGYQYVPDFPRSIPELAGRFVDSMDKRLVWFYSFAGFSLLPLLSPGSVLAVVFDLTQYFVLSPFGHMLTPFLHHRAILGVYLTIGMIDGLTFFQKKKVNLSTVITISLILAICQQYFFHHPLNKLAKSAFRNSQTWMEDTRRMLPMVPDGPLATTQHLVSHLSHRNEIYLLWPRLKSRRDTFDSCGGDNCWWLDYAGKPEHMFVNIDSGQWVTQLLESPENFRSAVDNMEKAGKIKLVKKYNSAYLYRFID